MTLKFRPHHFLCALGYQSKGYSPEFVQNFDTISEQLKSDSQTLIQAVDHTDSICDPCPNKRALQCTEEVKIRTLDNRHQAIHEIQCDSTLTWTESLRIMKKKWTLEKFHAACTSCSWKSLGHCETALKKLLSSTSIILLSFTSGSSLSFAADPNTGFKASAPTAPVSSASGQLWPTLTRLDRALKNSAFEEAQKTLLTLKSLNGYRELTLFLSVETWVKSTSQKLFEKKTLPNLSELNRSRKELLEVESEWPDSVFLKGFPPLHAYLDFFEAELAASKSLWGEASEKLERGFFRLFLANQQARIPFWALQSFVKSCAHEECDAWAERLQSFYYKTSPEFQILKPLKPKIERIEGSTRLTAPYKGPDLDQQAFEGLVSTFEARQFELAIESSKAFLEKFSKSTHRNRVRTLMARGFEAEKELPSARALYLQILKESPLSFYGLHAAMQLKISVESAIESRIPTTKDSLAGLTPWEKFRLQKARELSNRGLHTLAALYLKDFKTRETLSNSLVYEATRILSQGNRHFTALTLLTELIQRGAPETLTSESLRFVFPTDFYSTLKPIAEASGLDPILALSLTKQESAFDYEAVSSSGALGLMQLMPFTALEVDSNVKVTEVIEPKKNVALGTRYLVGLLKKYQGNIAKSLAAYNAGPSAVDRWIKEGRADQGLLTFIEKIPYKETRDYVGSIIRNYYWYFSRIEGERLTNLDRFWTTGVIAPVSTPTEKTPANP